MIITGTIQSDGTVGRVGGIIEKAIAAAKTGATIYVEEIIRIGPSKSYPTNQKTSTSKNI